MSEPVSKEDEIYSKYRDLSNQVRVRLNLGAVLVNYLSGHQVLVFSEKDIKWYKEKEARLARLIRSKEVDPQKMIELKTEIYKKIQNIRFTSIYLQSELNHFTKLDDTKNYTTFDDFTVWKNEEVNFLQRLAENLPNLKDALGKMESSIDAILDKNPTVVKEKRFVGALSKAFGRQTDNSRYEELVKKENFLAELIINIEVLIDVYGNNPLILLTEIIISVLKYKARYPELSIDKNEIANAEKHLADLLNKTAEPEPEPQAAAEAEEAAKKAAAEPEEAEAKGAEGGTLNQKSRRKRILRKNQSKSTHSRKRMLRKTHRKSMHRR
jgi:hypothetical protein